MTGKRKKPPVLGQSVKSTETIPSTSHTLQLGDDIPTLWQQAYNASPDMISILDTKHRIVSVNQAMAQSLRCLPSEAKGQYCYQLIHQADQPPISCPHSALLEDGKEHQAEVYEERLNRWLLVSMTPLYDKNRQLIGSIHIARDITRQKLAEQGLRESEERLRHLSEATMEGVLLSEDSIIIAANKVLAEMVGYSIEEVRGMNLLKFIVPQDRNRLIHYIRNNLTGIYEFQCIRKDGTIFPIEARTRAITYKGAKVYQTAIRDLTEQKRIEQQRLAHEKMQGVLEMAGAVCHEFNQPLMALQGFIDIVQAKAVESHVLAEHLNRMRDQIARLGDLTRKLMRITRYETKAYTRGEKIIDIDQATSEES